MKIKHLAHRSAGSLKILGIFSVVLYAILAMRSNQTQDEIAYSAGAWRWAILSTAGIVQISRVERYTGTVQEWVQPGLTAFFSAFSVRPLSFGPSGWSRPHTATVGPVGTFLMPSLFRYGLPQGRPPTPTPELPPPILWGKPGAVTFLTGTSLNLPYWFLMLLALTPFAPALIRKLRHHSGPRPRPEAVI